MYNPNWWKAFYFPSKTKLGHICWEKVRTQGRRQLSAPAQLKLEWIISHHTQGRSNAKATAAQFGVTRKTLHKWLARFKAKGLLGLEETSRAPKQVRQRQISLSQKVRVKALRSTYPKFGKMKLVKLYAKRYQEPISAWKIQKIIEEGAYTRTRLGPVSSDGSRCRPEVMPTGALTNWKSKARSTICGMLIPWS